MLVGTNEDGAALWSMLSDEPELGYRVGAVIGPADARTGHGKPWTGCTRWTGSKRWHRRAGATGVIVVGSAVGSSDSVRGRAVGPCEPVSTCRSGPGSAACRAIAIRMTPVSGVPMLYVEPKDGARWRLIVKRGDGS